MRVTIAYYLVLLYVTVIFKPVIPVVKDAFSHIFCEAIHIETIHAVYGNNHLQKEMNENNSDNNKHHNNSINEEVQFHVPFHEFVYELSINESDTSYISLKKCRLRNGFIIKFSPPPRFC